MDLMTAVSHMETPTLVVNHCNDVGCSHPSCWASRKLYRRNAYLLMLKGIPPTEIQAHQQTPERPADTQRVAEIPTQKVHNIVDELFNSIDGHAVDADDWHSMAGRGISAGQLSIKHMPTPMSSLSRQMAPKPRRGQLPRGDGAAADAEDDLDADEEYEDELDDKGLSHPSQGQWRRPVAKQRSLCVQDMSNQQHEDVGRQYAALHQHSREYVWVPNPNRKPKEGPLRRSDPDPTLACVNINQELGQYLQEDNYNQRQAFLQERAVERSHLSTARVQRFFKSMAPSSAAKQEPMTNESLTRMVEQAADTPTGAAAAAPAPQDSGSEFERYVLRQRRAQLHNSESGRNLREPQKHTTKMPVFLMDSSPGAVGEEAIEKRRLPPIGTKSVDQRRVGQGKSNAHTGGGGSRLVVGQFKRAVGRDCQLMLGPVSADTTPASSTRLSARSSGASTAGGSTSVAVECRSDRSTLLDEVLPSRQPGTKLDDPWSEAGAYPTEAPHPTTRDGTRLTTAASLDNVESGRREIDSATAGVCLSLTTPAPDVTEDDNESVIGDNDQEQQQQQEDEDNPAKATLLVAAPAGPGAPPPSPEVAHATVDATADVPRTSSPPPASPQRRLIANKSKSAASSGQLMPTLNEDEEAD
uniref:PEHE domain-containing protein n=1 Tax=Macrostomum lignano TaxID=282301 RepID=A0A1I8H594_9PLAT